METRTPNFFKSAASLKWNIFKFFAVIESARTQLPDACCYLYALNLAARKPVVSDFLNALRDTHVSEHAQVPEWHDSEPCLLTWEYNYGSVRIMLEGKFKAIFYIYCLETWTVIEKILLNFFQRTRKCYFFDSAVVKTFVFNGRKSAFVLEY